MPSTPYVQNVTPMVGVSGLILFPVTSDTKAELTTDDSNLIDLSECVVSKAYAPEVSATDFYSSNKKQKAVKSNKGGTLTYVIPSIRPELKARVLGAKKTTEGVVIQGSNDTSPEFICAHLIKLTDNVTVAEKFAKVVFSTPSESAETEKESTAFQTAELVGSVVPLNYAVSNGQTTENGGFLFSIDSENEKYSATTASWFTKGSAGIVPATPPVGG